MFLRKVEESQFVRGVRGVQRVEMSKTKGVQSHHLSDLTHKSGKNSKDETRCSAGCVHPKALVTACTARNQIIKNEKCWKCESGSQG